MNTLENYKSVVSPVPRTMLRWHLYGAGLENLGKAGHPEEVEVPSFGSEELLVRQDACGLCFSDTKVIALGPNHPRLTGRDMGSNPVTLGHEVAVTVVGVGESLKERFRVGERFVLGRRIVAVIIHRCVQADKCGRPDFFQELLIVV